IRQNRAIARPGNKPNRQRLPLNSRASPNFREMVAYPFLGQSEPVALREGERTATAGREQIIANSECLGCARAARTDLLRELESCSSGALTCLAVRCPNRRAAL